MATQTPVGSIKGKPCYRCGIRPAALPMAICRQCYSETRPKPRRP